MREGQRDRESSFHVIFHLISNSVFILLVHQEHPLSPMASRVNSERLAHLGICEEINRDYVGSYYRSYGRNSAKTEWEFLYHLGVLILMPQQGMQEELAQHQALAIQLGRWAKMAGGTDQSFMVLRLSGHLD